jgi:predicted DNA binding CopG/RHH family protein
MANKKIKPESNLQAVSPETVAVSDSKAQPSQENDTGKKSASRAAKSVAAQPAVAEKGFKAKASAQKAALVETADTASEPAAEVIVTEKPAKAAKLDKAAKDKAEKIAKAEKAEKAEKPAKMKRLTLDVSKPLHKAIKARAVEEGVAMADMLRSLLEQNYVSK